VLNVCEAVLFIAWPLGSAVVLLVVVLALASSSAAEEVLGRYARMEGLRCMGGAG
jgi:hypothetical protein